MPAVTADEPLRLWALVTKRENSNGRIEILSIPDPMASVCIGLRWRPDLRNEVPKAKQLDRYARA